MTHRTPLMIGYLAYLSPLMVVLVRFRARVVPLFRVKVRVSGEAKQRQNKAGLENVNLERGNMSKPDEFTCVQMLQVYRLTKKTMNVGVLMLVTCMCVTLKSLNLCRWLCKAVFMHNNALS